MAVEPFISAFGDLSVDRWSRINDVWVTTTPVMDLANDVFAELTYAGALRAAEAFGARLPSRLDIIALTAHGLLLRPVTLPTADMVHGMSEAAINAFRDSMMGGLEWSKLHTRLVREQMAALNWDGVQPVANAGKHWTEGAPPGRAFLMGWWVNSPSPPHFIQQGTDYGQGPHNSEMHDYASSTILIRDDNPNAPSPRDTDRSPPPEHDGPTT